MYSSKILRTVLIPAATVVVAEDQLKKLANNPPVCRPSELPIYTPEVIALPVEAEPTIPSYIEDTVKTVRTNVTKVYTEVMAYKEVGRGYLEQSKENADWLFQYLREEDNTTPKAGAIAIGGVTGLIFGLRGGLIKRAIYASTGALGMAAVCYPKEASEYSQTAISEAKKYATIAYNFAYGVKKDDTPLELPTLPKMPETLSHAWDSVTKKASSLVSGAEKEAEQVPPTDTTAKK